MTPSAHAHDLFLLGCVAATVFALLLLITKVRLHAAIALALAAFGLGIGSGMTLKQVPLSFTAGVGNMMGHIAIILGLGAILGCLLARSGGAQALGSAIVDNTGPRGMPFALMGLGIVVGMPVFFEVGLVLLMPIIAAAAKRAGKPPILAGLPLLAGLSIVHGTLPPHPAAMLAATQYHADLGRTIVLGLIIGIPSAILAGPCVEWALTWLRRRRGTLEALNKEQASIRRRSHGRAARARSRAMVRETSPLQQARFAPPAPSSCPSRSSFSAVGLTLLPRPAAPPTISCASSAALTWRCSLPSLSPCSRSARACKPAAIMARKCCAN